MDDVDLKPPSEQLENQRQNDGKLADQSHSIRILFLLLIGWGFLIALGATVMAEKFDVRKPLIVIGTMGLFLGVWLTAIIVRKFSSKR